MTRLGLELQQNRVAKVAEILLVFSVAVVVILPGWWLTGENLFARQAVVWVANVLMLITIWFGLRLRGQNWAHLGLHFRFAGWRSLIRTFLQSIPIFVIAVIAFVAGGLMLAGGAPQQQADMSSYSFLKGNLPMLLLSLVAVYIVSSFGEEVLYRGFLISRLAEIGKQGRAAWWLAIVASAVVFGLAHFGWGIVGIVQTTFMGLALGLAYLVTRRNLWALILAHAYADTLLLLQIYGSAP